MGMYVKCDCKVARLWLGRGVVPYGKGRDAPAKGGAPGRGAYTLAVPDRCACRDGRVM
jgi:hypothetical protein